MHQTEAAQKIVFTPVLKMHCIKLHGIVVPCELVPCKHFAFAIYVWGANNNIGTHMQIARAVHSSAVWETQMEHAFAALPSGVSWP